MKLERKWARVEIDNNLMYTAHPYPYKHKKESVVWKNCQTPGDAKKIVVSICCAAAAADFYCQDRSVAAREQIEIEFFLALVPSRNIENKCWKMQFNIYTHMRCIIFFPRRLQFQNRTESVNSIPPSRQPGAGFPRDLPTLAVTLLHC